MLMMIIMLLFVDVLHGMSEEDAVSIFTKHINDELVEVKAEIEAQSTLADKVDIIKKKYVNQINCSFRYPEPLTLLMWALRNDERELAQALLTLGADPNMKSEYRGTPLYQAACNGWVVIVNMLLEKGAEMNVYDECVITGTPYNPLLGAVKESQPEVVEILLKAGANTTEVKTKNSGRGLLTIAQERYNYAASGRYLISLGKDFPQRTAKVLELVKQYCSNE